MPIQTRRDLLKTGAASLAAAALLRPARLLASPFGLPIGLQLYSVRDLLPNDAQETLRKVAEAGYTEVEAAGFFGYSAHDVKSGMDDAGLKCGSGHYAWDKLNAGLDDIIKFHSDIGADYIICASPGHKTPPAPGTPAQFSLDDWRWSADQFNTVGKKVKAAGLRFGYHNHTPEFTVVSGVTPYDELLRLTDPDLVTFEMDCGWVVVAGADPITYIKKYPGRLTMFHVKDFKPGPPVKPGEHAKPEAAELGHGRIDYKPIFAAVPAGQAKHIFVEQEAFSGPPFEALKIDADYLRALNV